VQAWLLMRGLEQAKMDQQPEAADCPAISAASFLAPQQYLLRWESDSRGGGSAAGGMAAVKQLGAFTRHAELALLPGNGELQVMVRCNLALPIMVQTLPLSALACLLRSRCHAQSAIPPLFPTLLQYEHVLRVSSGPKPMLLSMLENMGALPQSLPNLQVSLAHSAGRRADVCICTPLSGCGIIVYQAVKIVWRAGGRGLLTLHAELLCPAGSQGLPGCRPDLHSYRLGRVCRPSRRLCCAWGARGLLLLLLQLSWLHSSLASDRPRA
jgi:hypothetical protein